MAANAGVITRKQAAIWMPIILAIISVAAVYALYAIDDIKNRDTILYAKFLANLKDRWESHKVSLAGGYWAKKVFCLSLSLRYAHTYDLKKLL